MTDAPSTTAPIDEVRARNKAIVFEALANGGIYRVTVDYDGSGDSGQIEGITAFGAGDDAVLLPANLKLQLVSPRPVNPPVETTLQEAIETLAYDYLEDTHCGWEHNDGAFGTFVFHVADRLITLKHNERFTEINYSTDEF